MIPNEPTSDLTIKYAINYQKLENVLPQHVASELKEAVGTKLINERLNSLKDEVPTGMHLDQSNAIADKEDSIKAELGCVTFIASLARVDGCVILSAGLNVHGFGVEITCPTDPSDLFIAGDELASKSRLRRLDFSHFGTRHRSMMRYCYSHPGSAGFVVSQDGDVRAITRVNKIVPWENVRLQDVEVVNMSLVGEDA